MRSRTRVSYGLPLMFFRRAITVLLLFSGVGVLGSQKPEKPEKPEKEEDKQIKEKTIQDPNYRKGLEATKKALPSGVEEPLASPNRADAAAKELREMHSGKKQGQLTLIRPSTKPNGKRGGPGRPTQRPANDSAKRIESPGISMLRPETLELTTTGDRIEVSGAGPEIVWNNPHSLSSEVEQTLRPRARKARTVIIKGDDPPDEVKSVLGDKDVMWVRSSRSSPNQDANGISRVADRLRSPPHISSLRFFDGLPSAEGSWSSRVELRRMGLSIWQAQEWRQLSADVRSKLSELSIKDERATKAAIMNELSQGSSDFVILVAHNDNGVMRLAGPNGDTLSLSDLKSLHRDQAPQRTVLLISCNAGTVNESVRSHAELILENKLADSVFATDEDVDAKAVPKLLELIGAGKLPWWHGLRNYKFQLIVFRLPAETKMAEG